jgi:DNA-binding NarL/FixJ family response regulator
MDIRMPLMDGIETLNTMLGHDRQVPIILNTAFPQYSQNFMTWAADAYVIKSSDLSELKHNIREVLEKREKLERSSGTRGRSYRKGLKSHPLLDERPGEF